MFNVRLTAMVFVLLGAAGCGSSAPPDPATPGSGVSSEALGGSEPSVGSAVGSTDDKEGKSAELPGAPPATASTASPAPDKTGATPQNAAVDGQALTGSLSKAEIRNIVTKHAELFDECYSIGAGKSMQFVATVTIKATIGPSGVVNETKVLGSNAKNAKVDQCVADAFKKIKFPVPSNGATSVITFPMEFQGAEQVK